MKIILFIFRLKINSGTETLDMRVQNTAYYFEVVFVYTNKIQRYFQNIMRVRNF